MRALPDRPPVRVPGRPRLRALPARRHLRHGRACDGHRRPPGRGFASASSRWRPATAASSRSSTSRTSCSRSPSGSRSSSSRRPARSARPAPTTSCWWRAPSARPTRPPRSWSCARKAKLLVTHRRLRQLRRHPGAAQLVRPRRLPRRGLRPSRVRRLARHGHARVRARQGGRGAPRLPDQPRAAPRGPGVGGRRPPAADPRGVRLPRVQAPRHGLRHGRRRGSRASGPSPRAAAAPCVPSFGRGCYGCFGPREQANATSLSRTFASRRARGRGRQPPVRRVHRLGRAVPGGGRRTYGGPPGMIPYPVPATAEGESRCTRG